MKKILRITNSLLLLLGNIISHAYTITKGRLKILYTLFLFLAITGILFFSQTLLVIQSVSVPHSGGNLIEGLVGSPVSVDPFSATTETEQALSRVFFSDLLSLASSIEWNNERSSVAITLPETITFHDKTILDAEDVIFTYQKAKTTTNQNSLFYETLSRTVIQKKDQLTITFNSTTEIPESFFSIGIAPKHIWEKESISQKESMIGTGPFLVTRIIKKNKEIVEIKTRRFVHYHKQTPFIKKITFSFFENTQALMKAINSEEVGSALVDTNTFTNPTKNFFIIPTQEQVAMFSLGTYNGIFTYPRIALLEQMIDKNQTLAIVRNGYGTVSGSYSRLSFDSLSKEQRKLFEDKGVIFTEEGLVSQSPSTVMYLRDDPELVATAKMLQNYYGILGLPIELKIFSSGVFKEEIEKKPSAVILGYTTEHTSPSEKLLFSIFSIGVGKYKTYHTSEEQEQINSIQPRKRYDDIETWSLRNELQWNKKN